MIDCPVYGYSGYGFSPAFGSIPRASHTR